MCAGHAQPFALAHGVANRPVMASQHVTARVHDIALRQRRSVALFDVGGEVVVRDEADALAVSLACILKALLAGDSAHVALLEQSAEGQQGARKAFLCKRIQHVALVF